MKKYIFHISGLHCQSCVMMTEGVISEFHGVLSAKVSLKDNTAEISGEFGEITPAELLDKFNLILKPQGYILSEFPLVTQTNWSQLLIALPFALAFIALFILLQKLGIVNLVTTDQPGYGTVFLIGVIASVSTCMAVVGGLVLSISANFAKEGDKIKPQMIFHLGRLISFFILGGIIGLIGSAFQLGITSMLILGLLVSAVLIILGINLLDVFPWAKKIQPTIPKFIGSHVSKLKNLNHTITPLLVGIATFFLPCGFTQSMQIYALSTGSFWTGSLIMTSFALGTLPVLAILSFGSLGIHNKENSGIFFKAAGLIVIFFGVYNLVSSLVAAGLIDPIFNF